jgi:hypothetical protein
VAARLIGTITKSSTALSDRDRLHDRVTLSVALIAVAGLVMIALFGCSNCAAASDTKTAEASTGHLSPVQCTAGAEILRAATESDANGNYVIQPGDQIAFVFYLNPEFNDDVAEKAERAELLARYRTVNPVRPGQTGLRKASMIGIWNARSCGVALQLAAAQSSCAV